MVYCDKIKICFYSFLPIIWSYRLGPPSRESAEGNKKKIKTICRYCFFCVCAVGDAVQQGDRPRARGGRGECRGRVRRADRRRGRGRRAVAGRRGLPVRRGLPTGDGHGGRPGSPRLFRRPGTGRGGGGRVIQGTLGRPGRRTLRRRQ